MKKVFLVLAIVIYCLAGMAQEKISYEQARSICAQEMAAFTKAVSGAYQKGRTYDQFQLMLCGRALPTTEGRNQLKVAYNFLVQGASTDFIIKSYDGREIAASINYLTNIHNKGGVSDGSELFGEKTGTTNSTLAKNSDGSCRWYQFWCLVQEFANWVVQNWQVLVQIIEVVLHGLP